MSHRFCVLGTSGSGKTHLARRLAKGLGLPHLELDALNHRAGWQEAPVTEFRDQVRRTLDRLQADRGGWVVDGNYRRRVADVIDADTYVWLDYSRRIVMWRVVRRSLGRVVTRRELWNGNRERWRSLVSRDPRRNIVLWAWANHANYRREYEEASARDMQVTWVRLHDPKDADLWLSTVVRGDA
jgi:adenylate kinase family enzyme